VSRNCVARPNGPRRSRLPRPSAMRRRDAAGSKTRRRLARRRGLSRLGTTRSRGGRLLFPSSSCPNGASREDSRDAFGIATGSARTQRLRTLGFPLGIAIVPIPMLGGLCDRSSIALIHGSRRDLALRQTICIAGPLKSPPGGTCGDTFAIATVSPRLSDQRQTVSDWGSPPYGCGCCGSAAAIHLPR
jgi:hypothetical protein